MTSDTDTHEAMTSLISSLDELAVETAGLDWTGERARQCLGEATGFVADYLDAIAEAPAWFGESDAAPVLGFSDGPTTMAAVLADFRDIALASGVNPVSSRFFGYVPGGGVPTSAVGDLVAAITNRYAGMYKASPGAAAIENELVEWLRDTMGMPGTAWGTLQSGGTMATLTALVAARSTRPLQRWSSGVIYSTAEIHGCLDKSITIAGLDGAVRRRIRVDSNFRLDPDDLARRVSSDRRQGLEPWIVAASAGTVNTGAVDPLAAIAEICHAEDLWMHVDGAYGGFFALTDEGRATLDGVALADSLVLDPHKGLFQRYGCGAVLVRDGRVLRRAMSYRADYLADVESEHLSPADYSPELTRHFRGLGLWMTLKVHGLDCVRAALKEKLLLGRYAHARLAALPGLVVGPPPQLSIATFRVDAPQDAPTQGLLAEILCSGRIHVSSTRLNGALWLRLCVLSFRSHRADVDTAIREIAMALDRAGR